MQSKLNEPFNQELYRVAECAPSASSSRAMDAVQAIAFLENLGATVIFPATTQ